MALNRNEFVNKEAKKKRILKKRVFIKLESKTIIHMDTQLFYSYIIINCIEKREKKINN